MYQDVKFISGRFYFEGLDGNYYPISMRTFGGGGKTVIQDNMKLHTVTFTRAQIIAFGTGVIADQAIVLPAAPTGYKNQLRAITETYDPGTGGTPFTGDRELQYFMDGYEDNGNVGNGLFTDNSDCLNQSVKRTTRVDLVNQRANNTVMQNDFQASLNSFTLNGALKIGTTVGGGGIANGNSNAILIIDVAYETLKIG